MDDDKVDAVFPLPLWAILLIAAICWPAALLADEPQVTFVAQIGPNRLSIHPEPCPLGGWFAKWRKATWFFEGRNYETCWVIQRDANGTHLVYTVDSDGEIGSVPLGMFKEQKPI